MRTVDRLRVRAPLERVFSAAADVERWPALLAHYRWVRMLERTDGGGLVEMAAWRPFGPLRYPTWWVSEMVVDRATPAVRYRHVRGITTGMDVEWSFADLGAAGTDVAADPAGGGGMGDRAGIRAWDRVADPGGTGRVGGGTGRLTGSEAHGH